MKSDNNLASACLRDWAQYFLHISDEASFRAEGGRHVFSAHLPSGKELNVVADTPVQLAKNVMAALADTLSSPPFISKSTLRKNCSGVNSQDTKKARTTMRSDEQAKAYTKAKQVTVGVSSGRDMYDVIANVAANRGLTAADVTRELVQQSLESFYVQIDDVSPRQVFESYERKLQSYGGKAIQWMARLDPDLGINIKLTAQEFKKSASQIVGFFVAEGLSHCAEAREALAYSLSNEEVAVALAAIEPFNGPKAKGLAKDVGLGEQRVLMNQVLSGAVLAPQRLLEALSARLGATARALSQAFQLRFNESLTPAFKAPDGSPSVSVKSKTWEEGVKALQLTKEEEQQLLAFED
jgi:AraC-like DNA-binding protein